MNSERIDHSKEILDRAKKSNFGGASLNAARLEKETAFELRESGKKTIFEAFGKNFPLDEFRKIYPDQEIFSDAKYVIDRRNTYETEEKFRAKNLERIITSGINLFGWLSVNQNGNIGKNAHAYETYKYDDYSNRNDTFVALLIPEKYRTEGSDKKLAFSIDITYNVPEFGNKLDRTTNNPHLNLPAGYSRLKYYNDNKDRGDRIIPRFIASVDYFDSNSLLKRDPSELPVQIMRFKLLDEFWNQASMLNPDNQSPNEIALTNYLESRLIRAIDAITKTNKAPSFDIVKKKIASTDDYAEKCFILENFYSGADETFGAFMKELHKRQDQDLWKNASKAS